VKTLSHEQRKITKRGGDLSFAEKCIETNADEEVYSFVPCPGRR